MMKAIGTISVLPRLPKEIARLQELAYNLWWSWQPDAQQLYARLDPELWERISHNPVKQLHRCAQAKLDAVAADPDYLAAYREVLKEFDAYMAPDADTWFKRQYPDRSDQIIAYFSAEFGLHEALPIYSGGLGILSGDHCKSASDLGLPFIGVGFLYPQGYFTQRIDKDGQQQAEYEKIDFGEVPAMPAVDVAGHEIQISVDLPGRLVYAKVWRIQVGRIPIFLMDTDVPRNAPQDRELSARLYGGDREMRISQEIVLGIGGVRAVHALGYKPAVWHMNEGHSAFLGLERARELVQTNGLTFDEAIEAVRANTIFTTHTPVPAGNDAFAFEMIDKFFWQYWGQLGIDRERFIQFAHQDLQWGPQYSMTVLALRLSGYANGVSLLHGQVSREMWQFLWPDTPASHVPIGHITNGVHIQTWLAPELKRLYGSYLDAGWLERAEQPETWRAIEQVPDGELWAAHEQRKQLMVGMVRSRLHAEYLRNGETARSLARAASILDPNAFTIGFARRFATYKRASLLFRDLERITHLLHHPERPVQIVFAGKAHPADDPGKALIREIYQLSRQFEFEGKIVFVENYDMNLARHLVAGVDVWLNTPRRPREASGTSGQKAALNGVPNLSILDGWWVEGYAGANGWAIGENRDYKDPELQDAADAESLYALLEQEVIPLFYTRDAQGVPTGWVQVMKEAIRTCGPRFSMRRMVIDYTQQYYLPADQSGIRFQADGYALARRVANWKARVRALWPAVRVEAHLVDGAATLVGDQVEVTATLWPGGLERTQVTVEAVFGSDEEGSPAELAVAPLGFVREENGALLYSGELAPEVAGRLTVGVRARPNFDQIVNPYELGVMRWA